MRNRFPVMFLLVGSSLMAQGVRVNGGAQVGLASPTGDFATKETPWGDHLGANGGLGCQLGGHLDFNLNPHHQLRFHVTVHGFVNGTKTSYDSDHDHYDDLDDDDFDDINHGNDDDTLKNTFGIVQLGGDYVFNFKSPSKGLYLLAGLHLNLLSKTTSYSNHERYTFSQSGRGGLRVGVGYTFNRIVSVEGQINSVSVETKGADGFGFNSLDWVSVSAVFRFGRP